MYSAIRLLIRYCHTGAIPILKQDKGFAMQNCNAKPSEQLGSAQFYCVFCAFPCIAKAYDSALQKSTIVYEGICSKLLQIDEKKGV